MKQKGKNLHDTLTYDTVHIHLRIKKSNDKQRLAAAAAKWKIIFFTFHTKYSR